MFTDVKEPFNTFDYLASSGPGRTIVRYPEKAMFFLRGSSADAVFYLHSGNAKCTVVSQDGKEVTVSLLAKGDFLGEEAVEKGHTFRTSTATAITPCLVLRIARDEMIRVLHEENSFSDFFTQFIVGRAIRAEADRVDQLLNCSQRRLARLLLMMADFGEEETAFIPKISQEMLAGIIGTTRSRVSLFMNRFRTLGYVEYGKLGQIEYNDRIRIHKSLLSVLRDHQSIEDNAFSAQPLRALGEPFNYPRPGI